MDAHDWLVILRDFFVALTWFVAVVYFVSGSQDMIYDFGAFWLRAWRRITYRKQPRLSLERLRSRQQQRIAVMVPAWNEGEVVASMVDNIIKRVEYENYNIFVGTYPNDPATQACVDRLAKEFPQIIKVVTARPGPTTKADCLHNVIKVIRAKEELEGPYDIIVMHDAEDWVHPQSFLLYNYLIPRVDVIQIPILPLPTKWSKWVHWIYADEFSENHMKDVPVREKISGFVPYAGTGTGFSRKVFDILQEMKGHVFNEGSMTEDYSMSKLIRESGMRSVFVNVLLADDKSPWWTPLAKRPYFISNWAYFPMDWVRSIRQKSRWIIGISLQEWEQSGWQGNWLLRENLVKDRKAFVAATASFLGYFVLIYFMLFAAGVAGWLPFRLLPVLVPNTALAHLVTFCTVFMVTRIVSRIYWVGMVYGLGAGLLAVPRLMVGNVLNGLATFRALNQFSMSRRGKAAVRWDNTQHLEGVGDLHEGDEAPRRRRQIEDYPLDEVYAGLQADDVERVAGTLEAIPRDIVPDDRALVSRMIRSLAYRPELRIRATVARAIGDLGWDELVPTVFGLLHDREWVVRSNAARALLRQRNFGALLEQAFFEGDAYASEVLVKILEQDASTQSALFPILATPSLVATRATVLGTSKLLRRRYEAWTRGEKALLV